MVSLKILTIIVSLLILAFIIELARRGKLTFKYAFGWIILSVLGAVLATFDRLLFALADFFGFQLMSNFVFFGLLCFFLFLSLMLTAFLCEQNRRNDIIAQKLGQLEAELKDLKNK